MLNVIRNMMGIEVPVQTISKVNLAELRLESDQLKEYDEVPFWEGLEPAGRDVRTLGGTYNDENNIRELVKRAFPVTSIYPNQTYNRRNLYRCISQLRKENKWVQDLGYMKEVYTNTLDSQPSKRIDVTVLH